MRRHCEKLRGVGRELNECGRGGVVRGFSPQAIGRLDGTEVDPEGEGGAETKVNWIVPQQMVPV